MADRVPWPQKTGGTWGPTTHSTCSPPFLVHSRVFRCDVIGAKSHERIVSPCSSMEASSSLMSPACCTTGRFDRITRRRWSMRSHLPPCHPTALQLRSATVRLPSGALPNRPRGCRMHCATRTGIRFNDALAIWQLMGCVTGPSEAEFGAGTPLPTRSPVPRGPSPGDRLALAGAATPPWRTGQAATAKPPALSGLPSSRSPARYA
jgi:hypothetical protein